MRRAEGQCGRRRRSQRQRQVGFPVTVARVPRDPPPPQALARVDELALRFARRPLPSRRDSAAGILWDDGEGQRLGQTELSRPLAEVHEAGGADPLDVASEGHEVQIGFEDLALAVAQLEPRGGADLPQLAAHRTAVDPVEPPRQLHRDRRSALAPAAEPARARAPSQRVRIDAGMPEKPPVFVQQHRLPGRRRDLIERDPEAVLLVGGQRETEQLAVLREDGRRERRPATQRWRGHDARRDQCGGRERAHDEREPPSAPARGTAHRDGRSTVICPAGERARTVRSYSDSPYAGGTTKRPTLVALIRYVNSAMSGPTVP